MDKTKIMKAEKFQAKLDKLVQTKEKKQAAFEKAERELTAVSKEVDSVKFKLFEILQSGSDDTTFSNWAKKRIGESGKSENANSVKSQNENFVKSENGNSSKSEKSPTQNHQPLVQQNHQAPTE